jgi:hypothetical protein
MTLADMGAMAGVEKLRAVTTRGYRESRINGVSARS